MLAATVALPTSTPTPLPEEEAHAGLSITQILTIARAYWKQSVAIAVATTLLAAVGIKVLPKLYTATATLMVSYEVNDPLMGKEFPIALLASYISTQTEIVQSPEVLLGVVDRLTLTQNKEFAAGYRGDASGLRDWVKDQLAKNVTVAQANPGSQLVYIKASAEDPAEAAAIANTVAAVYLEEHIHRSSEPANERASRVSTEIAELQNRVELAQQRIADFRKQTGVTDITATAADVDETLLKDLEQRYQEAQNKRRAAEVKRSSDQTSSDQVVGSVLVQGLRTQLAAQEAQLAQLQTTLGARHPKVIELQSQIQTTREAIASAVQTYSKNAEVNLEDARQYEQKLKRAVEEQRAKVMQLRNTQAEGQKLVLELESVQAAYKRALDANGQITLPAADPYTNVHLVSQAQPPVKADKPNKAKLALMAMLGGIGLGLVLPLAYELFVNRRVRCRDDIERDLGIDVLAELEPALGSQQ